MQYLPSTLIYYFEIPDFIRKDWSLTENVYRTLEMRLIYRNVSWMAYADFVLGTAVIQNTDMINVNM